MVATVYSVSDGRTLTGAGVGDGVVRISTSNGYGTGALLYDGRAILTAAHVLANQSGPANVHFTTASGSGTLTASTYTLYPNFDSSSDNHDLALLWLDTPAPASLDRYDLYRASDELGQVFDFYGYGKPVQGSVGAQTSTSNPMTRATAENRFEVDAATLKGQVGSAMSWSPLAGTQLVADFDDGQKSHDALGLLSGVVDTGLGDREGMLSSGDSGGPAMIGQAIAGVAAYVFRLSPFGVSPDIDSTTNSSFGELGAWTRVSAYQQWIDQQIRAHQTDAPPRVEEVQTTIQEGGSGSVHYTYFMVRYQGDRNAAPDALSVMYRTRDGTAKAGEDYVAAQGTLKLYAGEQQAVIAVAILGDNQVEGNETFELEIYNPVGANFGNGQISLVATRTIVDDDF